MKVCVVSTPVFVCPPPGYSGLEQLAWLQAKGLAEKGHKVSLVAPEGSSCPGVEIITCGKAGTWNEGRAYSSYWQHLLPDEPFDAVIDNSWNKWSYILKSEGKLKAPVLGVMHAPVNTMYQELPPVEKPCIVCISRDQGDHFNALFNRDCRVCHNGIDLDVYRGIGTARTDRYLFLARFSTIKGPDLAIKAALDTGIGLDLVGDTSITGEPDFYNHCVALSNQQSAGWDLRKGKQIRIVGPATRGEAVFWYSQARCMLHPNERFREPLGLAPLEAQACGTPVIAWNYGAMRETVKHGETGFLASGYENFVNLIRAFEEKTDHGRQVMRECAVDWARQFSIERMINRYDELVKESVDTGGW